MPINEAGGYRRSNLTKQQKREAEAAIYGLTPHQNMSPQQFAPEEIERMRAILTQYDATAPRKGIQEFDINNPPKLPYRFQAFPKMVYDHESRTHKIVEDAREEDIALADGYRNEPYPPQVPAPLQLDEADAAEVDRLDKLARKKKKE